MSRKGVPQTPEHSAKIAAALKGKPKSIEHRARLSAAKYAASKTHRRSMIALRFSDPRYGVWRDAVFARDAHTCQVCGKQFAPGAKGVHAHHLKSYARHEDLRYEVGNGVTVCAEPCHQDLHAKKATLHPPVACACGCGTMIPSVDRWGIARRYVRNHNWRGKTRTPYVRSEEMRGKVAEANRRRIWTDESKAKAGLAKAGKPLSAEHRARISAATTGVPKPAAAATKRGRKASDEHRAAIKASWERRKGRGSS